MSNNSDFNKTRYSHRDYQSLKKDLIGMIPSLTQKWTSTEESDPGIVLIKLMSNLGDNLSYNMDKMALEIYKDSVTQRKNCAKILSLIGYKMHWYRSARVTVTVDNEVAEGFVGDGGTFTLKPFETTFKAGDLIYTMYNMDKPNENVIVPKGSKVNINLIEGVANTITFTPRSFINNRYYFGDSNTKIDESTFLLYTDKGSRVCKLVDNLYLAPDEDYLYFEFNIDEYDKPYLQFPDYWDKFDINENTELSLTFIKTRGSEGNVTDNAFDYLKGANGSYLYTTNLNNNTENSLSPFNSPGKDPQTCNDARRESADYVYTYDTLVSASDFEKASRRVAGIYNSKLIDKQIIDIDKLSLQEILDRADDPDNEDFIKITVKDPETGDITGIKSYSVILYLIHQNFTNNGYLGSGSSPEDNELYFSNQDNKVQERNITNPKWYFPYRIDESTKITVDEYLDKLKIMNVFIVYGTTKVFPFYVSGVLHFIEPLSPVEITNIIDSLIDTDLRKHFSPDIKSFGDKPNLLELVDVIQNSDNRIKYYDSADTYPIIWLDDDNPGIYNPGDLDTTCFCKYQGLSKNFDIDEKFKTFSLNNLSQTNSVELRIPNEQPSGEDDPLQGNNIYEPIEDPKNPGHVLVLDAGAKNISVTCQNIRQIRTLTYLIQTGYIACNN